jgi:hypothetical protein
MMIIVNHQFNLITLTRMRYFLVLWWPIVILFAAGIAALPRWRSLATVFLLIWAGSGYLFGRNDGVLQYTGFIAVARTYPPMHDYAQNLHGIVTTTDYLLGFTETDWVNYDRDTMRGYSALDYYLKVRLGIDGEFIDIASQNWEIRRDIAWILDERPSLLFALNPQRYGRQTEIAASAIAEGFVPCPILIEKPDLLIQRYVYPMLGCSRDPAPIEYENGIRALDYAAEHDPQTERVRALLWWELPDAQALADYNISLQIVTPDWRNVNQADHHLDDNIVPWHVYALSTEQLPAGDYRLVLILYRRDNGKRVQGTDIASGQIAEILPLLDFHVE